MMDAFHIVGCGGNVRIQHSGRRHRSASVSRNDVFVPGLIVVVASAGFILLDCASTEPIMTTSAAAIVIAAVPKKRRRSWLIFFGHLFLSNWTQSSFYVTKSFAPAINPGDRDAACS
jgi:hypothetical protein